MLFLPPHIHTFNMCMSGRQAENFKLLRHHFKVYARVCARGTKLFLYLNSRHSINIYAQVLQLIFIIYARDCALVKIIFIYELRVLDNNMCPSFVNFSEISVKKIEIKIKTMIFQHIFEVHT